MRESINASEKFDYGHFVHASNDLYSILCALVAIRKKNRERKMEKKGRTVIFCVKLVTMFYFENYYI